MGDHTHMISRLPLLIVVCCVALPAVSLAEDWPQHLGPTRNGVNAGGGLTTVWPKSGPTLLWAYEVGEGFAGPAVAKGKLVLFHRVEDHDAVDCVDAITGKLIWRFRYPTDYRDGFGFDNGPRAVPAIADGRVYTFGAQGLLHCLDFKTGKKLWAVDTRAEYRSDKGFFGSAASPLVEGDHVVLNVGGRDGHGIVAFDRKTGKLAWHATDHEAGYSSPTAATIGGRRYIFVFTREGLVALNPKDGKVVFQFPFRARMNASVNAATPLIQKDLLFLSTSYRVGGKLIRVKDDAYQEVWANDTSMSNHYATCVIHDGHLYGLHGRQEYDPELRCVELTTGKVKWSAPMGAATVTLAGQHLLVMTEQGELIMAEASPNRYKKLASAPILAATVRAYPALAADLFYARNGETLVCIDLRRKRQGGQP